MNEINLPEPLSFQWDEGNKTKIYKRNITINDCEQAFNSDKIFIQRDHLHSETEDRYVLINQPKYYRHLFIVFTIRNNLVRIISARYMHRKEIKSYEEKASTSQI